MCTITCYFALLFNFNYPGVDIWQGIPTNKVTALNKQIQIPHALCTLRINVDFYVVKKINECRETATVR